MGFVWVALGGAVGSSARYGINLLAPRFFGGDFPWATLIVNLTGCLAMGAIAAVFHAKLPDNENIRLFLTTGLLGGFTTFSAFSLEVLMLMQRDQLLLATIYAVASLGLSIAAALAGFKVFS